MLTSSFDEKVGAESEVDAVIEALVETGTVTLEDGGSEETPLPLLLSLLLVPVLPLLLLLLPFDEEDGSPNTTSANV